MTKIYLTDLTFTALEELASSLGEPPYRARQLLRWIYQGLAHSFEEMTDLPLKLRENLAERAAFSSLTPLTAVSSPDGRTKKVLFALRDGKTIEAVLMYYDPSLESRGRRTVCVSTQAGCPLGCLFCATGQQGFERNLTSGEILEQVLFFAREIKDQEKDEVSNVVFMGMGEPLANYEATIEAIRMLNSPQGFGLGARHLTLSTVGLVPGILKLAREGLQLGLALSLHAPNNELRSRLVPINQRYPVEKVLEAARYYQKATGRRVSFEYVLLSGVNDSEAQAQELAHLLSPFEGHVNLIPANRTANPEFHPPSRNRMMAFQRALLEAGINATLRRARGQEIQAGCGQLRGDRMQSQISL